MTVDAMRVGEFHVVPGKVVSRIIEAYRHYLIELVRNAYVEHEKGGTIKTDS